MLTLLSLYCDPHMLVIVLNMASLEQDLLVEALTQYIPNHPPRVFTNEQSAAERSKIYLRGGEERLGKMEWGETAPRAFGLRLASKRPSIPIRRRTRRISRSTRSLLLRRRRLCDLSDLRSGHAYGAPPDILHLRHCRRKRAQSDKSLDRGVYPPIVSAC